MLQYYLLTYQISQQSDKLFESYPQTKVHTNANSPKLLTEFALLNYIGC